jgi:hypothetical protein
MAAAYLKIYEQLAAGAGRSVQTRFAA